MQNKILQIILQFARLVEGEKGDIMKIDAYRGNVSFSRVMGKKTLKETESPKKEKPEYKYMVEKRGQYIDLKI